MRGNTKMLLIFLVITRVIVLVLPWLAINLLFPDISRTNLAQFTQIAWNRWDAPHYLYLAQNWYVASGDPANFIVFFPLYPLILKGFLVLFGDPAITGVFVSTIFFFIGSYLFYKLLLLDYPEKIARFATIALAIFPTSYFFNSPYTESLFLIVFCGAMYSARKQNWFISGIFAGLATLTRPLGLLVLPTLLMEWFGHKQKKLINIISVTLPTIFSGFIYLYLNKITYGNPFQFREILATHWQKNLVSPISSLLGSWGIALSGGITNFVLLVGWAEALTITISWILIPFAFIKLRKSWAVFYTLNVIIFSSTGFILSTPRYLLSVPPLFVLIALAQKNQTFRLIWSFVSSALLISLAILFARGQWAF